MKNSSWLAVLAVALSGAACAATTMEGMVVSIQDGDTVTLLVNGHDQHRIRLAAIDAPEIGHGKKKPGQPFGEKSRQSLAELVFRKTVRASCGDNDRYGRSVCDLYVGTTHVNAEQVARGFAMVYRQYAPAGSSLYALESVARRSRLGVWEDKEPTPPWDWRRSQRGR